MATVLQFTILMSLALGCSKLGSSSKEKSVEEPTDVAGGFGLTMQCSVLNSDDSAAASSSIGCMVFNDDGSRYTGSISDGGAEIVTTSGQIIKPSQFVTGANAGSYAIGVEASGLKPSDAATIRVTATFDKSRMTLVSNLKSRFTTTCTEDVTYYVNASSSASNNLCSEAQPCRTIGQAIRLLPDTINCKITVNIASGVYQEDIALETFQVLRRGSLTFMGSDPQSTELRSLPTGPAAISLIGFNSNSVNRGVPSFQIKNMTIIGNRSTSDLRAAASGRKRGINSVASSIHIENTLIQNFDFGINTLGGGTVILADSVKLQNVANGVWVRGFDQFRIEGALSITGLGFDENDENKWRGYGVYVTDGTVIGYAVPYQVQISGFQIGAFIENSGVILGELFRFEIIDSSTGIRLEQSTFTLIASSDPKVAGPVISVNGFRASGLYLINSKFSDASFNSVTTQSFKPVVTIIGIHSSHGLIHATDRSQMNLTSSGLSFCSRNSSLAVPGITNASYSMEVSGGSRLDIAWDASPYTTSCNPPNDMTFHVKTYNYRIPLPQSGVCLPGYAKGSDNLCYGDVGYAVHTSKKPATLNLQTNFGVSADDSRLDNL